MGPADQRVPDRVEGGEAARRRRGDHGAERPRRRVGRHRRVEEPRPEIGRRGERRPAGVAAAPRLTVVAGIALGEIRDEQRAPVRRPGHLARDGATRRPAAPRRRRRGRRRPRAPRRRRSGSIRRRPASPRRPDVRRPAPTPATTRPRDPGSAASDRAASGRSRSRRRGRSARAARDRPRLPRRRRSTRTPRGGRPARRAARFRRWWCRSAARRSATGARDRRRGDPTGRGRGSRRRGARPAATTASARRRAGW